MFSAHLARMATERHEEYEEYICNWARPHIESQISDAIGRGEHFIRFEDDMPVICEKVLKGYGYKIKEKVGHNNIYYIVSW